MNIGATLFGDAQGVLHRMFGLVRTIDRYDDE